MGKEKTEILIMKINEEKIARECVERIHYLWFESRDVDDYREKITALFDTLAVVAPTEENKHLHYLWLAYWQTKDDDLWYLARCRWRLFSDEMHRAFEALKKAA
jgi:hypothetical protein